MNLKQVVNELSAWFARERIEMGDLTVIINFKSADPAIQFDMSVRREFEPLLVQKNGTFDIREFQLMGIKFLVESPVHTP